MQDYYWTIFIENTNIPVHTVIKLKDHIVGVNNQEVKYYDQFKDVFTSFANQNVELNVVRDGQKMN